MGIETYVSKLSNITISFHFYCNIVCKNVACDVDLSQNCLNSLSGSNCKISNLLSQTIELVIKNISLTIKVTSVAFSKSRNLQKKSYNVLHIQIDNLFNVKRPSFLEHALKKAMMKFAPEPRRNGVFL